MIVASLLGSESSFARSYFVLPFDTNKYSITSNYGMRIDPISHEEKMHNGIDLVPHSDNIVAIANGIVIESAYLENTSGEYVVIEHKVGGMVYQSGYAHLQLNSRTVKVGDTVSQGQQLGIMGSTGYSTGKHLHFTLKKFNTKTQKFEYTNPDVVINNKISAKEYSLYDYNQNKFELPYNNGLPNIAPLPSTP